MGLVDLVALQGTDVRFAMKTLDKWEMQERNKVARAMTEQRVLREADHPFVASMYAALQTDSHLHLVLEYCEGGELYALLNAQPRKRLREAHARFATHPEILCRGPSHFRWYPGTPSPLGLACVRSSYFFHAVSALHGAHSGLC